MWWKVYCRGVHRSGRLPTPLNSGAMLCGAILKNNQSIVGIIYTNVSLLQCATGNGKHWTPIGPKKRLRPYPMGELLLSRRDFSSKNGSIFLKKK